jgi:hypothetical protein
MHSKEKNMTLKSYALGGAAAAVLMMMSPASAFTFHPATPAEIKQTDDLNAQALANARGQGTTTNASFSNDTSTNATTPKMPTDSSAPSTMTKTKAKMNQQPGAQPAQTDDNSVTPAPTNGGGQ